MQGVEPEEENRFRTVARLFDDNNPAVKKLIADAIRAAQRPG
jgi:hypothetical protein